MGMTMKQRAVAKDLSENIGKPVSRAMLDAGYTPSTAEQPQRLTNSKAFKELLEAKLPDDKLLDTHADALEAMKWNDFTGEREKDHAIRLKAVDLGYKLKGKLQPAGININDSKVLIVPSELMSKYGFSSNAEDSS